MCAPSVSTVAVPGVSSTYRATGECGSETGSAMRRGADGAALIGRAGRGVLKAGRAGLEGAARPESPRRWTLPITALRVMPRS
jgi:hypothetical protein